MNIVLELLDLFVLCSSIRGKLCTQYWTLLHTSVSLQSKTYTLHKDEYLVVCSFRWVVNSDWLNTQTLTHIHITLPTFDSWHYQCPSLHFVREKAFYTFLSSFFPSKRTILFILQIYLQYLHSTKHPVIVQTL